MRARWVRLAVISLVVAAGSARAGNRGPLDLDLGGTRLRLISSSSGSQSLGFQMNVGKKAPVDPVRRVLLIEAKNANLGYGYDPIVRALWAPFRWEVSVGMPLADQIDGIGTGSFGTELAMDGESFDTFSFSAVRNAGGLLVEATTPSHESLGTMQFNEATAVDLAIEHDGTTLHFLARTEGDANYAEVGSIPFAQTQALFPVLSAYAIASPATIGFDRYRVRSSAEAPLPHTGAADGIERIYDAFDVVLDVLHRLDGPQTETLALHDALVATNTTFSDAVTLLPRPAMKKLVAAGKKVQAAIKAIERGKPTETPVKALRSALSLLLAARNAAAGS